MSFAAATAKCRRQSFEVSPARHSALVNRRNENYHKFWIRGAIATTRGCHCYSTPLYKLVLILWTTSDLVCISSVSVKAITHWLLFSSNYFDRLDLSHIAKYPSVLSGKYLIIIHKMGTKGTFVNEIFRFCLNISIKFSQKAQSLDLDVQLLLKLYSQNNLNYDNLTLERLKYCLLFRVCGCRKRSCNMKIVPSGNEHEFADYCCWGRPYFRHRRLKCRPLAPTRCFHTTRYIWQMKVSFSYSCKHWLILHSWAPVHISNQSLSLQKQNMIMAKHQSFKSRYYMRLFKPRFGQLNRKCTGVQLFTLEFYLTMFYPTP